MADDTPDIVLSGEQRKRLCDALVAAFPTDFELEQFVTFELEDAASVVTVGSVAERAFRLMRWAQAQGRLRVLVIKAHAYNRAFPNLDTFVSPPKPSRPPEYVADLRDLDTFVRETLAERPNLSDLLVGRVGCSRATLQHSLIHGLPARDIAAHFNALDQMLATGDREDRIACRKMLLRLLPMVADWRALREQVRIGPTTTPKPVSLPYRSETLAEIVLAGGLDCACRFVVEGGRMPAGLGLVRLPAASQTALFPDEGTRLVEQVVQQLAARFMMDGVARDILADTVAVRLRRRRAEDRLQFYFLFHDAEHPHDASADHFWTLTREAFSNRLADLQVVRMARRPQGDELEIADILHDFMLREQPRDKP